MNDFFVKNAAIFTEEERALLKEKKVLIVGCGGLGGSLIELVTRTGIGHLTVIDRDVFEFSNMNRQLLCTTKTLGTSKAEAAAERVRSINPDIDITAVQGSFSAENARELVRGQDIVIDALDSISARFLLEDACAEENVILIHGAVSGWTLQTGVCPPGLGILHKLYGGRTDSKYSPGGIAMTIFACTSFQVSEAVKILLGREDTLYGKILFFDLLEKESMVVPFTD